MYAQLFRYLMCRPEKYSCYYGGTIPTLLLLDEFPRLGKIEGMAEAMSTLRSKDVNICLVMQSAAQMDKLYGPLERRILLDNCQYQAIFRASDSETQKYLAELIGTQLHLQHSISEQLDEFMLITGYSRQLSESRNWTVCPHDLSSLEDVLLLTPYGFCRTEKNLYTDKAEQRCNWSIGPGTASMNDPILFWGAPAMENQEAVMLTIEDRLANANKRVADAKYRRGMESNEDEGVAA